MVLKHQGTYELLRHLVIIQVPIQGPGKWLKMNKLLEDANAVGRWTTL